MNKVNYINPMLSLQKAWSYREVSEFVNNTARDGSEKYECTIKFDGIAARYENGVLSTRGNGQCGFDVSDKIASIDLRIGSSKLKLANFNGASTGEIICTNQYYLEHGNNYKTARNFVAAMMALNDIPQNIRLDMVDYNTSKKIEFCAGDLSIHLFISIVKEMRGFGDYPYDGVVVKIKDNEYFNQLGVTAHHPRGSIAYKF